MPVFEEYDMDWRLIFSQSRANSGWYDEESLPTQVWAWPQDTWLKKRLRELRDEEKKAPQQTPTTH